MTTTRHISAIETLGAAENEQISQALEKENNADVIPNENSHDPAFTYYSLTLESGEISKENSSRSRSARIAIFEEYGYRDIYAEQEEVASQLGEDEDQGNLVPPESEPHLMALLIMEVSKNTPIASSVDYRPEPKFNREARRSSQSDLWAQAAVEELRSLEENGT
uniref:Uncharacterized protein n=1 Tax=Hyaloperonospora arabidopsidis (strain Emoy2) TaxID=559515 RepID=M4BM82_HYAAE